MTLRSLTLVLVACAASLLGTGCHAPGKPMPQSQAARPDQLLDFASLYGQNCAACHGDSGRNGAAISLANPVYLATAGADNLARITASGVPGTSMPPFGKASGGMLTDRQIHALVEGMLQAWARPGAIAGQPLAYGARAAGDPTRGLASYTTFCARCHGSDGSGMGANSAAQIGSIVDPSYLALVSDQSLRSTIIAGVPEQGMPDWRADLTGTTQRAMTDGEVTDVVAWIASHRSSAPGQPYQQHP